MDRTTVRTGPAMAQDDDLNPAIPRVLGEAMMRDESARRKIDALRARTPKPPPVSTNADDWDLDTARHAIEELQRVSRVAQPSQPEIHVHVGAPAPSEPKSDPPSG